MTTTSPPRVTEVAFTKNEGRFLLEWIAYHRLIGVNDFLVYTNDCEDGSPELLDRLEEMGIATHVPNPVEPGEVPQMKALAHGATHPLVLNADWVLQIDPDEFLVVKAGGGTIHDLIAIAPEADCICIQMRFFGDNDLLRLPPDALVTESLTGASTEDFAHNRIVKSVARNSKVFSRITANHMPMFPPSRQSGPRIFNGGGVEVPPEAYDSKRFRDMPDAYRSTRYAQLNHYAVRTLADYRAKIYRGDAASIETRFDMSYWRKRNRNEVRDTTILPMVPQIRALIDTWLADPVLASLNRRCVEAYEEILRKSESLL